jgi:hypothetical protein
MFCSLFSFPLPSNYVWCAVCHKRLVCCVSQVFGLLYVTSVWCAVCRKRLVCCVSQAFGVLCIASVWCAVCHKRFVCCVSQATVVDKQNQETHQSRGYRGETDTLRRPQTTWCGLGNIGKRRGIPLVAEAMRWKCWPAKQSKAALGLNRHINTLNTKCRPLYLKTQSVPRCKHFSSRL